MWTAPSWSTHASKGRARAGGVPTGICAVLLAEACNTGFKPLAVQLNRGEGRYQLARIVFHGNRGELRQRYREGQEDQLAHP